MRAIEACGYIMYFFESDYVALMMAQSSLEEYVVLPQARLTLFCQHGQYFHFIWRYTNVRLSQSCNKTYKSLFLNKSL